MVSARLLTGGLQRIDFEQGSMEAGAISNKLLLSDLVNGNSADILEEALCCIYRLRSYAEEINKDLDRCERNIRERLLEDWRPNCSSGKDDDRISDIVLYGDVEAVLRLKSEKARAKVFLKLNAMAQIETLIDSGVGVCEAAQRVSRRFVGNLGFGKATLYRDYSLWSQGGQKVDSNGHFYGRVYARHDWALFIPNYNNGCVNAAYMNKDFILFIKKTWDELPPKGRNYHKLRKHLFDMWIGGREIPGFGTADQWAKKMNSKEDKSFKNPEQSCPAGWSSTNLRRIVLL